MNTVSTAVLRNVGAEARASQPAVYGYCYPTSKQIVTQLNEQHGLPSEAVETRQVRLEANPSVKHEVATVRADYVEDTEAAGRIIVDATLDQYCTTNEQNGDVCVALGDKESLQDVYLYESITSAPYYFG